VCGYDASRAPSSERQGPSRLTQHFSSHENHHASPTRRSPHRQPPPDEVKRKTLSITSRNLLMVVVGVLVFAIVASVVLYSTVMYGDQIPNFGIILMLTVPVIAGVAFRVGLDAWLDRE
jgi:hypothetical protein